MRTLSSVNLANKRVLMRVDLNVPVENGKITNDKRIRAILPSIQYALSQQAAVMLISHFGRPTEGEFDQQYSLEPIASHLSDLLGIPVHFEKEWIYGVEAMPGEVVLCENTRFLQGEKANDVELAKQMASLCDIFVMDAFATAHRAQASTVGIAENADVAVAGLLLEGELSALQKGLADPKRPVTAIVGGSKLSTKLIMLKSLVNKVDTLIVAGGMANTFLAAKGLPIGNSLYQEAFVADAKSILATATEKGVAMPLPSDVVVATEFSSEAAAITKSVNAVLSSEMIMDVGPETAAVLSDIIKNSSTILWNGPMGVFEFPAFAHGTEAIANAVAQSNAYSIAGGGDTVAAIEQFNIADSISYISTGGGAFLQYVEGRPLPGLLYL